MGSEERANRREDNQHHGFGLLIKKDLTRYFGFFKEGEMNGRFYARNLQGEVYKQNYKNGKLLKEERELKFNNFFEILKLEHLDYRNIYKTIQMFQKDSMSNLDSLSLQRQISVRKRATLQYYSSKRQRPLNDHENKIKSYSLQDFELNFGLSKAKKQRKNSLVLDKVFLEDQNKATFASPDMNSSPSDHEPGSDPPWKINESESRPKEKEKPKSKEANQSLTLKKYFQEDSARKISRSNSFEERQTMKAGNSHRERNWSSKKLDESLGQNFIFIEEKLKKKVTNNKKSFLRNIFSGFLKSQNNDKKEQLSSEGYEPDLADEAEEDEDLDGLGKRPEPDWKGEWPLQRLTPDSPAKIKHQERTHKPNVTNEGPGNEQSLVWKDTYEKKWTQDFSGQVSPKMREGSQYNSMCFNSLTVNGFIKDPNSVENDRLNGSNNQFAADADGSFLRKRESLEDRRKSVITDEKVAF